MVTHTQHAHKHVTNDSLKKILLAHFGLLTYTFLPSLSRHQLFSPVDLTYPITQRHTFIVSPSSCSCSFEISFPVCSVSLSCLADFDSLLQSMNHFLNRSPLQRPLCVKGLNQARFYTNWSLARILPTASHFETFPSPRLPEACPIWPGPHICLLLFCLGSITLLLCHLIIPFVPMFQETRRKMPLCIGLAVATWYRAKRQERCV